MPAPGILHHLKKGLYNPSSFFGTSHSNACLPGTLLKLAFLLSLTSPKRSADFRLSNWILCTNILWARQFPVPALKSAHLWAEYRNKWFKKASSKFHLSKQNMLNKTKIEVCQCDHTYILAWELSLRSRPKLKGLLFSGGNAIPPGWPRIVGPSHWPWVRTAFAGQTLRKFTYLNYSSAIHGQSQLILHPHLLLACVLQQRRGEGKRAENTSWSKLAWYKSTGEE